MFSEKENVITPTVKESKEVMASGSYHPGQRLVSILMDVGDINSHNSLFFNLLSKPGI